MNKTRLKKHTIKLLRAVRRKILQEPRQFMMHSYYFTDDEARIPNCGTAACIAGWAIALDNSVKPSEAVKIRESKAMPYFWLGVSALKVADFQGEALFSAHDWPREFGIPWFALKQNQHKRRARVAADRITHFIKTGK